MSYQINLTRLGASGQPAQFLAISKIMVVLFSKVEVMGNSLQLDRLAWKESAARPNSRPISDRPYTNKTGAGQEVEGRISEGRL